MVNFSIACVAEAFVALAPFAGVVAVCQDVAEGAAQGVGDSYGDYVLLITPVEGDGTAFGKWDAVRRYFCNSWVFDAEAQIFTVPKA